MFCFVLEWCKICFVQSCLKFISHTCFKNPVLRKYTFWYTKVFVAIHEYGETRARETIVDDVTETWTRVLNVVWTFALTRTDEGECEGQNTWVLWLTLVRIPSYVPRTPSTVLISFNSIWSNISRPHVHILGWVGLNRFHV